MTKLDPFLTTCSALPNWPDDFLPYICAGFDRVDQVIRSGVKLTRTPHAHERRLPLNCITIQEVLDLFAIGVPDRDRAEFRSYLEEHLTLNGAPLRFWHRVLGNQDGAPSSSPRL